MGRSFDYFRLLFLTIGKVSNNVEKKEVEVMNKEIKATCTEKKKEVTITESQVSIHRNSYDPDFKIKDYKCNFSSCGYDCNAARGPLPGKKQCWVPIK